MRTIRKSRVYPSDIRPFRAGDRAALWFGKILVRGTIVKIYTDSRTRETYVVIDLGSQQLRQYPIWQMIPIESTRFTFHHLLYSIVTWFEKFQRWGSKTKK
jgi:hypothetical protein